MDGDSNDAAPPGAPSVKGKAPRTAFDSERAKAAGKASAAARKGKGAKGRGLAVKVRRHRDEIIEGMLEIARKSKSETARARMYDSLARIGWGAPASAAEMGAIDPVEGAPLYGDNPRTGGLIFLPATEAIPPGLAAVLERMEREAELDPGAAETIRGVFQPGPQPDLSHLTNGELAALKHLGALLRRETIDKPEIVILPRERYEHERIEPPYIDRFGRLVGIVPGCLSLPAAPVAPAEASPPEPMPVVANVLPLLRILKEPESE